MSFNYKISDRIFDIRERWLVAILLIFAFAIRLYLVSHTYVIAKDGILYIQLAKLISQGKMGDALRLYPFNIYPFFIVIFQKVFHDWEVSAQMISALFGTLAIVPFYFLIKRLFSREVALISSIFFVFQPYLVRFSAEVIRGPSFWFFFLTSLWVGWEAITRKSYLLFVFTSLLGVMSFLLRPEGLFVLPIIAVWAVLKDIKGWKETYKQRLLSAIVLLFLIPTLLLPAIFYLKSKTGHRSWARMDEILRKTTGDSSMNEIKKNLDRVELKSMGKSRVPEDELNRLKYFLSIASRHRLALVGIEGIYKFLKALHPLLFILLVFGAIKRKKVHYRKDEERFLLSVWAIFILISVQNGIANTYIGTRHMMVPAILSLAWVGAGVLELDYRISKTSFMVRLVDTRAALLGNLRWILLGLFILALLPKTISSQRTEKLPIKKAGIWMKEHGPKNPVIMSQRGLGGRIAFYADGTSVEIPHNQKNLFEAATKNRVKFLAINEKNSEMRYPGLLDSLNPEQFKEEVVIGNPSRRYVIRIYSVRN